MIENLWLWFCILAIVATTVKVFYIKKIDNSVSNLHILFFSRLAACIVLIPFYAKVEIPGNPVFWLATGLAVFLTTLAGYTYIEALKKGMLSVVASIQATIPIFMVVIIALAYQEFLTWQSLFFLVGAMLSLGILLFFNKGHKYVENKEKWKPVLLSLLASFLYAASTVLDRVAISSVDYGALNYTFIWNAMSLVFLFILMRGRLRVNAVGVHRKWLLIVACSSTIAFVTQQYAVQYSLFIPNGVTYVKSLVMFHIAVLMILGVTYFDEKYKMKTVVISFVGIICSVGLALSSMQAG